MTTNESAVKCDRCGRTLRSARSLRDGIGRTCKAIRRAEALDGFKPVQAAKALDLIAAGGIAPAIHPRLFFAISSDGFTRYVVDTGARNCTCPGGQHNLRCYHLLAGLLLEAAPGRLAADRLALAA